jgi:putative transposase
MCSPIWSFQRTTGTNCTPPTNPLERLNKEIKRRTNVIGIFPNDDAIFVSLALTCSSKTTSGLSHRYMSLENVAEVCDDHTIDVAKIAAL